MVRLETSPLKVIRNEISSVTAALRRNARWASGPSLSFTSALLYESQPSSSLMTPSSNSSMPVHGHTSPASAPAAARNHNPASTSKSATNAKTHKVPVGPALFADLQLELKQVQDPLDLDACILLLPFLDIVRSGDTSGPITSVALNAIDQFITLQLIHPHSPSLAQALQQLSEAATHCKFEASDTVSDELVLAKIQDVLVHTLTGPLGPFLTDEAVCSMMETVLGMCCQMRLSEMLRKTSEKTMQCLTRTVLERLQFVETPTRAAPSHNTQFSISAPDPASMKLPVLSQLAPSPVSPDQDMRPYGLPSITELLRVLIDLLDPRDHNHTDAMRLLSVNLLSTVFQVAGTSIGRFPSLRNMVTDRLCKFLLQLASSASINNSQHQVMITAASLRLWTHLLDTLRPHLKLQQELLVSFLMDRLAIVPGKEQEQELDRRTWDATSNDLNPMPTASPANPLASSVNHRQTPDRSTSNSPTPSMLRARALEAQNASLSPEIRALLLEHLCLLAREPDTPLMLWQNYDCQLESEDLWQRLVRFFSRGVYPTASHALLPTGAAAATLAQQQSMQDATQLMCLDTVLTFVSFMAERTEADQKLSSQRSQQTDELLKAKNRKQILLDGAIRFNTKPKHGLAYWKEQGVLSDNSDVEHPDSAPSAGYLARFLKDCPKLDKKVLGEYISAPEQLPILQAYMRLFDFSGKIISDAMRELLETFRLPGEAQPIARITETFAEVYYEAQKGQPPIKSQDAVYVLAYSVIMLNTDQHNPQNVKNRMKVEDYRRNLRGVNEGEDFPLEYLEAIYDEIKRKEIVLPEEHQGSLGFDFAWKELLRRSGSTKPLQVQHSFDQDRELFMIGWKPVVSAISYAFTNFNDDAVLQKALVGFQQVAELASRFDFPDVFDHIIFALARITGLSPGPANVDTSTFPKVEVPVKGSDQQQEIIISPLSVRFGTNVKAQLAAVVLFAIANNHSASIRKGWIHIIEVYQTLFIHSLLPASLLSMEDFLAGTSVIPLKAREAPSTRPDARTDGGLLSALSSYLLSPQANVGSEGLGSEMTEDDIDDTLSTVDCISSCRLEELYAGILSLPSDTLESIMAALTELLSRPSSGTVSGSPNSPMSSRVTNPYDPCTVFILELMVGITSRASHALDHTWPIVSDYLHPLLSTARLHSSILLERAVIGLLRVASAMAEQTAMQESFFEALDMLKLLPAPILSSVADQLSAGLIQILGRHWSILSTPNQWALVFSFFSATAHCNEAAQSSFTFLQSMLQQKASGGLSTINYIPFIESLNAFASAAGIKEGPEGTRFQSESSVERGRQALDMIRDSQSYIPEIANTKGLDHAQILEQLWLPVLAAYSQQATNACREIRQAALAHLQRTLIACELLSDPSVNLSLVFDRLIFPMLDELLKPQVFRRDPAGMGETRLRAVALLCKIFLHSATQQQKTGPLLPIWSRVLDAMDRMMHSGRKDAMFEAVPEQLKNAVLVMTAQEILVPPSNGNRTEDQAKFWDATFSRIDTFLPNLQAELFPDTPSRRPAKVIDFSSKSPAAS